MKIVSVLCVFPVPPGASGYRVDYLNHIVIEKNAEAAFERIEEQIGVKGASMIYVQEFGSEPRQLSGTVAVLKDRATLAQHFRWDRVQKSYKCVVGNLINLDRLFNEHFFHEFPLFA